MRLLNSNWNVKSFLGGLCLFLLIPPNASGIPPHLSVAEYGLLVILFLSFEKNIFKKRANLNFALAMSLLYFIIAFHSKDLSVKGFVYTSTLPLMMWAKRDFIKSLFDAFTKIYVCLMLLSCVIYILVLVGVPLPHEYWSLDDASSFAILDVYAKICGVNMLRFCGLFQEPGVVGTISATILIAYRFKLKPLYIIVLVFSGIASFSLAFFAIISLYAILGSRSWKVLLSVVIVSAVLYFFFYSLLDELVLYKFSFNSDTLDFNRVERDFSSWYNSFKKTDAYYWGLGGGSSIIYNFGGASYKNIIVDYGLIFFIVYVSCFAIHALINTRSLTSWLAYLLILFLIIFQRPFIELPTYIFLLYGPITLMNSNQQEISRLQFMIVQGKQGHFNITKNSDVV